MQDPHEYNRQYYLLNKDKIQTQRRKTNSKNPELFRQQQRERKRRWDKKAMLNPMHRLSNNLRGGMHHALKGKKGFRKWEDLVGYTLQDLINHLTPLLGEGMTWENYGKWHIDHKIPKSWFRYESADDPKFKECWALSNLQPLWAKDNVRKHNSFSS